MRCSRNARPASRFLLAALVVGASSAAAQTRGDRSENMRMPGVSIEGERQKPDIFFVFPTGKGGNLSAPRLRDYAPDILDPVVKPWFERDQMVNPLPLEAAAARKFDWDEALKSEPSRPAEPVPTPAVVEPMIPSQARSMPRAAEPAMPSVPPPPAPPAVRMPPVESLHPPEPALPAPPPPPPPQPPPQPARQSRPAAPEPVPILVPPQ